MLLAAPCFSADILRCAGPKGEILYTDRGCPEGYLPVAIIPTLPALPTLPEESITPSESVNKEMPDAEPPREPVQERHFVEEYCSVGAFRTEPVVAGFAVIFTNLSPWPCSKVFCYCLWGMVGSTGFYQQSESAVHEAGMAAWETRKIAEIEPRGGPADRQVAWSWCAVRR